MDNSLLIGHTPSGSEESINLSVNRFAEDSDSINPLEIFNNFDANLPTLDDAAIEDVEVEEYYAEGEEDDGLQSSGGGEPTEGSSKKSIDQLTTFDTDFEDMVDFEDELMLEEQSSHKSVDDSEDEGLFKDSDEAIKSKKQKETKTSATPSWIVIEPDLELHLDAGPEEEVNLAEVYGTDQIIDYLVSHTVILCEYEDSDTALRNRLHPEKLVANMISSYQELQQQQKKRFLLNRKVVEYFRRKKNLRALTDDSPDIIIHELRKYRNNMIFLDNVKGRQRDTKNDLMTKINALTDSYTLLNRSTNHKIEMLNEKLKDTGLNTFGKKTGLPVSDKLIEFLIRKMNTMRNQISHVRLNLVKCQHTIAVLQEKAKKLEDLGNGLSMFDFEQLRAETQGLGEKIEERNTELIKLRNRCNSDTHIQAHIREKQKMLTNKIVFEEEVLFELKDEQNSCRSYLHDLKLERDTLRRQYNLISFQSGLLDKPILLNDYDKTTSKIEGLQLIVNQLTEKKKLIMVKLEGYHQQVGYGKI